MNMIVDSPVLSAEMGVGGMTTERLEAEITSFAADLTAALCRWLLLVGEYDRRGAYEQWECVSMAQWLGVHVAISAVTARQHVIVARRLGVLPAVTEAFGQGRVSYSRVRALCRVATPQDETSWLDLAVHATAAQLDRIVSDTIGAVNARDPDQGARQVAARRLSWSFDDDGLCHLTAVLPPDTGAVLGRLLKAERDDSHDCKDEVDQRNADAFTRLLQRLAAGQEVPGDTPVTSDAPVPGPDGRTGAVPGVVAMIVVHVHEDGTAQLEDGPYVSAGVVDRLAPNAVYLTATHSEDAIRYGHRRRTPPPAMRRYRRTGTDGVVSPVAGQPKASKPIT